MKNLPLSLNWLVFAIIILCISILSYYCPGSCGTSLPKDLTIESAQVMFDRSMMNLQKAWESGKIMERRPTTGYPSLIIYGSESQSIISPGFPTPLPPSEVFDSLI